MEQFYTASQYVLGLLALVFGAIGIWGETKEDDAKKKKKSVKRKLTKLGKLSLVVFFASSFLAFAAERTSENLKSEREQVRLEDEQRKHEETLRNIRGALFPIGEFDIEAYISVEYEQPIKLAGADDEQLAQSLFQHEPGLTDLTVLASVGEIEKNELGNPYARYNIQTGVVHDLLERSEAKFSLCRSDGDWGSVENPSKMWLLRINAPGGFTLNRGSIASLVDLVGLKVNVQLLYCFNRQEIKGSHRLVQVRVIDRRTGLAFTTDKLNEVDESVYEGLIPGLSEWE